MEYKFNLGVTPTSVILRFKLLDSTVTTGVGVTGLTYNSANLIIATIKSGDAATVVYTQAAGNIETITTLGTYAAPTASKCRFKEVDATNHPGVYELHLADARFETVEELVVSISGVTGLMECDFEVQCTNLAAAVATGSSGLSVLAESFSKDGAEPETNTYTATQEGDLVYHIVEDDAGAMAFDYVFDVGGNGIATAISWLGYVQGNGDEVGVWYYDWGSTGYKKITTLTGSPGVTPNEEVFTVPVGATGTGANLGKVILRFDSATATAVATDLLLCAKAVVTQSIGYSNGCIWIDTNVSNTNTEAYVDGTADNPVSTWAAAKALNVSLGITNFHILNGSTITMDASCDNFTFLGHDYALALGGQSFENAHIEEANVSGIGTAGAGRIHFHKCRIGSVSLGKAHFHSCGFDSTVIGTEATTYIFEHCFNDADGSTPPIFDFGAAIGSTHVGGRDWHGGVEIANLGQAGTDVFSITGQGKLIIAGTCVGGTIKIFGDFIILDNVAGGFAGTLIDDARYDTDQLDAAHVDYGANTTVPDAAGTAAALHATTDGKVDVVDANVDSILVDTGTDIPATLTTIDGKVDTIDATADAIKLKTDGLPVGFAKDVAFPNFMFTMVDADDIAMTGLTVAGTVSLDGAAFGGCGNAVVEVGSGYYKLDLLQAEMNADIISFIFSATGAKQRNITLVTDG